MKDLLEGFLSKLETESMPKEGEYLGEDGLLYCGNCHTPVQCRKEFLGKMRTLPCTCKCRLQAFNYHLKSNSIQSRRKIYLSPCNALTA